MSKRYDDNSENGSYVNNLNIDAVEIEQEDRFIKLNLMQLFFHVIRHWKLLIIAMIIGVVLGAAYQRTFVGTTYTADTSIFIADTEKNIDVYNLSLSNQLSVDYQKILVSRQTLKDVIADTGVDMNYRTLAGLIGVSMEEDSHIIRISVTTSDRELSRILANSMMRVGSKRIQKVTTRGNPTVVDYPTKDAIYVNRVGYRQYPAIGGLLAVLFVAIIYIIQFLMDRSFKNEDEVIEKLKKPVLAAVPYYGKNRNLVTTKLNYYEKEAFNTLYGNIKLSGIENRVVAVTSSNENEGKSSLSFKLAEIITDFGKSVCYVDCDMRNSDFYKLYGIDKNECKGLSELLSGQIDVSDAYITHEDNDRLGIIPAGKNPPNPSALLSSRRFDALIEVLKKSFDYIILDTPPVNAVIDGVFIAKHCDATILVVESGSTDSKAAIRAMNDLNMSNINVIGVVINKIGKKRGYGYGYGYGYGKNRYGYGKKYGYGRKYGYGYGYGKSYGYGYGHEDNADLNAGTEKHKKK